MTEGKRFDVVLLLEVDGSVIEKASDASTLNCTRSVLLVFRIAISPCVPGLRTYR